MGEIPWYGIVKLVSSDRSFWETIPSSSKTGFFVSIVLIFSSLFIIETVAPKITGPIKKRFKGKKDGEEGEGEDEDEDKDKDKGKRKSRRSVSMTPNKRKNIYKNKKERKGLE